jgi:hypothetical protein
MAETHQGGPNSKSEYRNPKRFDLSSFSNIRLCFEFRISNFGPDPSFMLASDFVLRVSDFPFCTEGIYFHPG